MKKLTIILLLTFVVMTFSGCTKSNQKSNEIIVGVVAPLSGQNASYGDILRRGFSLVFDTEKNINLHYEDSKFEPRSAVSAINKLISFNKVKVVLGEVASGVTSAIAPITEKNKVVLFSTISSSDNLKDAGDYFFRNIPRNNIQGKTIALFIFNKLNKKKVALYGLNDEYGTNISTSFKQTFSSLGGEIVFEGSHLKGQKDFRTTLVKIKISGAEALFIPGDKNEPAIILKQAKQINLGIPILGGDGSANQDVISVAGDSSEGFYCSNVLVDKSTDYFIKYHKLYTKKYGEEPGAYDAYAYEGAMIILEAIKNVGNDSDKVRDYLYKTTFKSMTGELKFDKDGEVDRLYGIYQVQNGIFVEIK